MPEYTQARLDAITQQIADLVAERKVIAKEVGAPLVQERFAALFHFPGVFNARWTQYTPHFNDGDPCEFSVYASLSFNGEAETDEADEDLDGALQFDSYDIRNLLDAEKDEPNPYLPGGHMHTPKAEPFRRTFGGDDYNERRAREWDEYKARQRERTQAFRDIGWNAELVKQFDEAVKSVEGWLESSEDFLQDAFGDGVQIVVSRNGVEVNEFDHD